MPPPGRIEKLIEGKPAQERGRIKAKAIADAIPNKKLTFSRGGIVYDVRGWDVDDDGVLSVTISARDSRGPIPTDTLYRFVNPPVRVPDGTERDETDAAGETRKVKNFKEDELEAARQIVIEAVRTYATSKGWTP